MRVGFDEQIFLLQRQGGISRYFRALAQSLPHIAHPAVAPVLLGRRPRWAPLARGLRGWARVRPTRRTPGLDLVHRTFYHPAWLRDEPGVPLVVTVVDMIPEEHPESVPPGVHRSKREYVQRADLILTISESAKADLLRHYGVPNAPVLVTPLGVGPAFRRAAAGGGPGLPRDYLVFVGNRGGYKDFPVALAALARLPEDVRLVAAGGGPWTTAERLLIERHRLAQRVRRVDCDDSRLAALYAGAVAAVVPSRYEGFGLPVLEAMAAGTVVVAADSSSLPEVGGEVARYFTPGAADELARVIAAVPRGGPERAQLVAAGRERAATFTWQRTAQLTAEAYASIL